MNGPVRVALPLVLLVISLTACSVPPEAPVPAEEAGTEVIEERPPIDGLEYRFVDVNGLRMRVVEQGEGPLVLLAHGWPESWYSWRHQLPALAAAGYRAVAPDMVNATRASA